MLLHLQEQCCIVRITHVHQTLISPREAQLPVCSFLRQRLDRTQENAAHPTYLATHRVRQPSSWIVTASFVLVGSEAEAAKLSTGFMKCLPRTSQCISKSSLGSPSFPGALSFAIERKARFTSFSVQSADTPSADACDNLLPSAGSQAVSSCNFTLKGAAKDQDPTAPAVLDHQSFDLVRVSTSDRVEHAVEAVTFAERGMLLNLERILHQHLPDQLRQDVSRNDA
ncbi:unnamed protein product [Closterium sp. NIES-54]